MRLEGTERLTGLHLIYNGFHLFCISIWYILMLNHSFGKKQTGAIHLFFYILFYDLFFLLDSGLTLMIGNAKYFCDFAQVGWCVHYFTEMLVIWYILK